MTILQTQRFAIIGVGNIGCILLERLLAAGVPTTNLAIYDTAGRQQAAVVARIGCAELSLANDGARVADPILNSTSPDDAGHSRVGLTESGNGLCGANEFHAYDDSG